MHLPGAGVQRIGRYSVVGLVGKGGMASTYLCTLSGEGGFTKWVIVKLLLAEHRDDAEFVSMFYDEARLGARLEHPHIPRVFELGEHRDLPYFVMDYVRGPTLYDLIRRAHKSGRMSLERVCWIIGKAARADDYAMFGTDSAGQRIGALHRDISLDNILVTSSGSPKLIDFGIAHFEGRATRTEGGILKGKVQYLAPEQLADEPLDHRVDVFQLGVALFFATTGRRPFRGSTAADLWRDRLSGDIPHAIEAVPDFPEELDEIIFRAMAFDPDDRYPRARNLADALDAWIAGQDGPAPDEEAVALWIEELFPEDERPWRPEEAPTSHVSLRRSMGQPDFDATDAGSSSRRSARQWMVLSVAAVLFTAAFGLNGAAWLSRQLPGTVPVPASEQPAPPAEPPVASAPAPAPAPRATPMPAGARVVKQRGVTMVIGPDGQMMQVESQEDGSSSSWLLWASVLLGGIAGFVFLGGLAWMGLSRGPRPPSPRKPSEIDTEILDAPDP